MAAVEAMMKTNTVSSAAGSSAACIEKVGNEPKPSFWFHWVAVPTSRDSRLFDGFDRLQHRDSSKPLGNRWTNKEEALYNLSASRIGPSGTDHLENDRSNARTNHRSGSSCDY